MSRGYNEQSFREDLKVLYNRLGIENRHIAFVLSDQHVVEEGTRCCTRLTDRFVDVWPNLIDWVRSTSAKTKGLD